MQLRPGMPESFRDYLRQRWEAGYRHGRGATRRTLVIDPLKRMLPWRVRPAPACAAIGPVTKDVDSCSRSYK